MIDLHSHPLPGVDDGARDEAAALALLRAMAADGIHTLAATPHVDRRFGVSPAAIAPAVTRVRELAAAADVDVTVVPGAEIALDRLVDLTPAELDGLGLGGGPCLLLECPIAPAAGDFEWPARRTLGAGVPVLLAHPERCPDFQRNPRRLAALVEAGAMVQLTAPSLRGDWGAPALDFAIELARTGLVHNLASDAHDALRRPSGLTAARTTLAAVVPGGDAEAVWLTETAPAAILMGVEPPSRPA